MLNLQCSSEKNQEKQCQLNSGRDTGAGSRQAKLEVGRPLYEVRGVGDLCSSYILIP
jgi:hypothetical protein